MPVEILDSVEATAHLDPLELGALINLCRAFWAGGARPLPSADVDLMRLSGCDLRRWRLVRDTILPAFESLKEPIASVYAQSVNMQLARQRAAYAGHATVRARKPTAKAPLADSASDVSGQLVPAKRNVAVNNDFTADGVAIPKRVQRSNGSPRLTERA